MTRQFQPSRTMQTPCPSKIGFLLIPGFAIYSFASAIEPLRVANRLSGKDLYSWKVSGPDGQTAQTNSQLLLHLDGALDVLEDADIIFVVASHGVQQWRDTQVTTFLRRMAGQGKYLGGICSGSWVLASTGLLNGHRCTIHWDDLPGFKESFPECQVTSGLFQVDGHRYSCSGAESGVDMMLYIIARDHGQALANEVCEQFIHERIRRDVDQQRTNWYMRIGITHPQLANVADLMEKHLQKVLGIKQLAATQHISQRQLERLFKTHLSTTPANFYKLLRVKKARRLLTQTTRSVLEISQACGFRTQSHFSRCYADVFGHTPTRERARVEGHGVGVKPLI